MKISIPHWLGSTWEIWGDWANVPIWSRGRLELRRLDVVLAVAGIGFTAYYWIVTGWQGALQGAVLYIAGAMLAMFML